MVSPATAVPGATVTLTGRCYFLHSGRRADVYFDTTRVGEVIGDTPGSYTLDFSVPADARAGAHVVRVVGAQSTTLRVERPDLPTPRPETPCLPDRLTVVPNGGAPGTRIVISGYCYYVHSGRTATIYFDDTALGMVHGDTSGGYAATFVVPVRRCRWFARRPPARKRLPSGHVQCRCERRITRWHTHTQHDIAGPHVVVHADTHCIGNRGRR